MSRKLSCTLACIFIGSAVIGCAAQADPIFDAMQAEMKRSMTLSLQKLEKPYFVSYTIDTGHEWSATAVMGGLLGAVVRAVPLSCHAAPRRQLQIRPDQFCRRRPRRVLRAERLPARRRSLRNPPISLARNRFRLQELSRCHRPQDAPC